MLKPLLAVILFVAIGESGALAQTSSPLPSPPVSPSTMPPMPSLPPGIGPQTGAPNNMPSAPAMPPVPNMPGTPAGVGARPLPPQTNEPVIPAPARDIPLPSTRPTSLSLISFLDSTAPYVQAFDLLLMIVAGIFCVRARKAPGLTILAISCFVSAVILLGFFLFGIFHGSGAFPQAAYIVARVLAPFELLLFFIGIIIVAQRSRSD